MIEAVREWPGQKTTVNRDIYDFSSFSYKLDSKIYYIQNQSDIIDDIYLRADFWPVPDWKETGMDERINKYRIRLGRFKDGRGYMRINVRRYDYADTVKNIAEVTLLIDREMMERNLREITDDWGCQ